MQNLRVSTILYPLGVRELRELRFTVASELVVIEGRVSCYYIEHMAEESVRPCAFGWRTDRVVNSSLDNGKVDVEIIDK